MTSSTPVSDHLAERVNRFSGDGALVREFVVALENTDMTELVKAYVGARHCPDSDDAGWRELSGMIERASVWIIAHQDENVSHVVIDELTANTVALSSDGIDRQHEYVALNGFAHRLDLFISERDAELKQIDLDMTMVVERTLSELYTRFAVGIAEDWLTFRSEYLED